MRNIIIKLTVLLSFVLIIFSAKSNAEVLDKTAAVFNDEVITLSEIKRIQNTLQVRQSLLPMHFNPNVKSESQVLDAVINTRLIRAKLAEMGYAVSDAQVESRIKQSLESLGATRGDLEAFLSQNKSTYSEYFEVTRQSLEYGLFMGRVIAPLITISEQDIKNSFYRENSKDKTLSFVYDLVDFTIPAKQIAKKDLPEFKESLKKFQATGVIPSKFSSMNTNVLGNISEDGLTPELIALLKSTDEGDFSNPIDINGDYHVFFIKTKNLTESSLYQKEKKRIEAELFQKESQKVKDLWYQREITNHYVKSFIK